MHQCRFCLESQDDLTGLISPCSCSGTAKYVHRTCLEKYYHLDRTTKCKICNLEYVIYHHLAIHKRSHFFKLLKDEFIRNISKKRSFEIYNTLSPFLKRSLFLKESTLIKLNNDRNFIRRNFIKFQLALLLTYGRGLKYKIKAHSIFERNLTIILILIFEITFIRFRAESIDILFKDPKMTVDFEQIIKVIYCMIALVLTNVRAIAKFYKSVRGVYNKYKSEKIYYIDEIRDLN